MTQQEIKWADLKVGDRCIVFDSTRWAKSGDKGDNSQFFIEAEIIRERTLVGTPLVDVLFDDGRISNGHLKSLIEPTGTTLTSKL